LAMAPAIGLWLVDRFSFQALFISSSLLTMVSLVLALIIKFPKHTVSKQPVKLVFMEKLALRPSVIILLTTITYSALLSFLTLFIQQKGISADSTAGTMVKNLLPSRK